MHSTQTSNSKQSCWSIFWDTSVEFNMSSRRLVDLSNCFSTFNKQRKINIIHQLTLNFVVAADGCSSSLFTQLTLNAWTFQVQISMTNHCNTSHGIPFPMTNPHFAAGTGKSTFRIPGPLGIGGPPLEPPDLCLDCSGKEIC